MHFDSSKLSEIKKWQIKNKKFRKTVEVSIKTICRKWEGELLSNDSSFLSNLKNLKINTILII